ncbi:transcription termination/antitermination protein NusG [Paludibacter sp.]
MSETSNFKWYVLRAFSGKENKVKEYIDAEIKNTDLGQFVSQVVIPTEKKIIIRNGKHVTKEINLMPGYVLVEANLVGEIAHRLRQVPNVFGFLEEKNNVPTPVRSAEVNRILGVVDEMQESSADLLTPFLKDENVKVVSGPFNGFTGVIEEINNERKKLKVMVFVFGRKTSLELSFNQVERE